MTSFDHLVDEAATVSVEGWDFAWLTGRWLELASDNSRKKAP